MQNNLMKVENNHFEEDEVDIYKLVNIFLKNIKIFIIVSIIGILITGIYIAKRIIFDKNNVSYIDYTLNYEEINSYIGNNIYYPKKNPEGILADNKYLELLFENPELIKTMSKAALKASPSVMQSAQIKKLLNLYQSISSESHP